MPPAHYGTDPGPGAVVGPDGAFDLDAQRAVEHNRAAREDEMTGRATATTAPPEGTTEAPSGLPLPPTRLVGRREQLRRLCALLQTERLVTLTGPPGSGKTRLAIEVAHTIRAAFADGAWFAPLAPIQAPEHVANAVARTLGLKELGGAPMQHIVGAHLAERELLLVLDNFEHVLDGAGVVAGWLAAAPRLRCLVTSRAALHLTGEHEFAVPPLDVPNHPNDPAAAESEAVQLFNERAAAVAGFEADERTLPDVAYICRRLDGLPLALELAAARTKALPVADIRSRLSHSLDLLTRAARDVPERHRSLHAAVSWSFGLMSPAERTFFRRLSVFRGGWSLEAADAVTLASAELGSDPLDLTTLLLDESLIRRLPEVRLEARYDVLETLREYGRERLAEADEADATADRHAEWYLALAERAAGLLTGSDRGLWLDRLEREMNNFRAAMRWAIDRRRVDLGMRLGSALWRFWQTRAHITEGRQLMAELLGLRADVDPRIRAGALSAAGSLAYWQADANTCVGLYEEAVRVRRAIGEQKELASALYDLGHALSALKEAQDFVRGRALETEALEIYRSLGDRGGEAWLIWALGCNSHFADDNESALPDFFASVERFRSLGDQFGLAWALTMAGLAALRLERRDVADGPLREALGIFAAVDDVSGLEAVLEHLARLAGAEGHTRRAIRLAAAAARVRGVSQTSIAEIAYPGASGSPILEPGAPISGSDIDEARREGEAMSTAEAVAYALEPLAGRADQRLRVHALGPMLVERRGSRLQRWGGDKAGSRQAQALFAFLFDRGPAGIAKDEATELIWPDLSIRRGDLAFHRTLGGLRSVLDEGRRDGGSIAFEGGRYRLAPDVIAWSDVSMFESLLSTAMRQAGGEAIPVLEEARRLYRGDLFDDCPFYGDSAFVEERRADLRLRFEALLVELGDRYTEAGDAALAAERYRQALAVNRDDASAIAGLERLAATLRSVAD
ncbi:MAG: AAA family ATPase [Chloroflexi bacterium]|nr:AAA family ATPase [Chloroflexota bacterium]